MKKIIHYIPHIIFAGSLIFLGAFGKLTGNPMAVGLFENINLFGLPEHVVRYTIGLGELFAAIGVFFRPTKRIAALVGIGIMLAATFFHLAVIGGSPVMPIVIIMFGLWILFMGYGCEKCSDGSCMVCETEEVLTKDDLK